MKQPEAEKGSAGGLASAATYSEGSPICWRESESVYRPTALSLCEFLSGVQLLAPCETGFRPGPSPLVFIEQSCVEAMEAHARSDVLKEQAGILCGHAYVDTEGRYYVSVTSALAVETLNDAAHFSFRPGSWEAVWGKIEDGSNIVGWYHTHPGMGVFLSPTDLRTQELYFKSPWQVAVVLDPISRELGAFCGAQGRPARRDELFLVCAQVTRRS